MEQSTFEHTIFKRIYFRGTKPPIVFGCRTNSSRNQPQQSSSTEHSKKEIQAATFLAEGALSYHIIVLNHFFNLMYIHLIHIYIAVHRY